MYRAERRAEKKSKAGVAVFVPWTERSRLLLFLTLFLFNLDLQRVLSLIDGFYLFASFKISISLCFTCTLIQTDFVFSFGGTSRVAPRPYSIFSMICCLCCFLFFY